MKLTTQLIFQDYEIQETMGIGIRSIAKPRHVGAHFLANIREIFGGEISSYTILVEEARQLAIERLIQAAQAHSAMPLLEFTLLHQTLIKALLKRLLMEQQLSSKIKVDFKYPPFTRHII